MVRSILHTHSAPGRFRCYLETHHVLSASEPVIYRAFIMNCVGDKAQSLKTL